MLAIGSVLWSVSHLIENRRKSLWCIDVGAKCGEIVYIKKCICMWMIVCGVGRLSKWGMEEESREGQRGSKRVKEKAFLCLNHCCNGSMVLDVWHWIDHLVDYLYSNQLAS